MPKILGSVELEGSASTQRRIKTIILRTVYDSTCTPPRTRVVALEFEHEKLILGSDGKELAAPSYYGTAIGTEADALACPSFREAYTDLSELGHRLMDQVDSLKQASLTEEGPPLFVPPAQPVPPEESPET